MRVHGVRFNGKVSSIGNVRRAYLKEKEKMPMKIALAANDDRGLGATISQHFGRCPYYIIVDVDGEEVGEVKAAKNPFYENHGQPGQVPSFIKDLGADVIIAGGMGPKAIGFFEQLGIQAVTGASGLVGDVVSAYMNGQLEGAGPCSDHHHGHDYEAPGHDEATQLKEEIAALRGDLAAAAEKLRKLEAEKKRED
jgi:predicted Fe-Mo cluster-binding NifX family protein